MLRLSLLAITLLAQAAAAAHDRLPVIPDSHAVDLQSTRHRLQLPPANQQHRLHSQLYGKRNNATHRHHPPTIYRDGSGYYTAPASGMHTNGNPTANNLIGCAGLDLFVDVTIGNAALTQSGSQVQTYRLIVDSGSTTVAVAGWQCGTNCFTKTSPPVYTPTATAVKIGKDNSVTAKYGGGAGWTGTVYNDQLTVGGSSTPTIPLNFAVMTSSSSFFHETDACYNSNNYGINNQGIFGIAYSSLALPPTESWLAKVVQYKNLANVFSMQMCETTGKIWFGGLADGQYCSGGDCDPSSGTGVWVPITDTTYYTIAMNDLYIGGQSTGKYSQSTFGSTIADSGTSLITLPSSVFDDLTKAVTASSQWSTVFQNSDSSFFSSSSCVQSSYTPAQINTMLPNLTMSLCTSSGCASSAPFTVAPVSSYLQKLVVADPSSGSTSIYYCTGIQSTPGSGSGFHTILGIAFLNFYTTIYDVANSRLGLVPTAGCPSLTDPNSVALPYVWTSQGWSLCSSGSQSRQVRCTDQNGLIYLDSKCTSTKPATSQSCSAYYTSQYDSNTAASVCTGVSCGSASQGFCQAGMCLCINGFGGSDCSQPPSIFVNALAYNSSTSKVTLTYNSTGQFSVAAAYVAPAGYQPAAAQPSTFPFYATRSFAIDTSGRAAIYNANISTVPTGMGVAGISQSPQQSYLYSQLPYTSAGNCSAACPLYGGINNASAPSNSSTSCQCLCPALMTYNYVSNKCQCTTPCNNNAVQDSNYCYCIGCSSASNNITRWTGYQCDVPYSPVYLSLTGPNINSTFQNTSQSQYIAFTTSLTADLAFAAGVSQDRIIITNLSATGSYQSQVSIYVLGNSGDVDTTNIDGIAYTLSQASNHTLSYGLVSQYISNLNAPYAKNPSPAAPVNANNSLKSFAERAKAWIAENWRYLLGGILGGLGAIVVAVGLHRWCCTDNGRSKRAAAQRAKRQQAAAARGQQARTANYASNGAAPQSGVSQQQLAAQQAYRQQQQRQMQQQGGQPQARLVYAQAQPYYGQPPPQPHIG